MISAAVVLNVIIGFYGVESPWPLNLSLIPQRRFLKIIAYRPTMMIGTPAILYYGMHNGSEERAVTLAFTTFVLFQFFNVFNVSNQTNCKSQCRGVFNIDFGTSGGKLQ